MQTIKKAFRNNKIMLCAIVVLWLSILQPQTFMRIYDNSFMEKPWISASLNLVHAAEMEKPSVMVELNAVTELYTIWDKYIFTEERGRVCGEQGRRAFSEGKLGPELWAWEYWLGKDCEVPEEDYKLCVTYSTETDSRAKDVFGPYCTQYVSYYENNKTPK